MKIDRRAALAMTSVGAASLAPARLVAKPTDDVLGPELFGAKGDGRTNDTDVFGALSNRNSCPRRRRTFDPSTGRATENRLPFYHAGRVGGDAPAKAAGPRSSWPGRTFSC